MRFKNFFEGTMSLLKGMKVTLKYILKRAITMQYPDERWELPSGYRGKLYLEREKCIVCLQCQIACPNNCIKISSIAGETKKKVVKEFHFNMGTCLFCGLCVEPCPTSALKMSREYELACYDRSLLLLDLARSEEKRSAEC